MSATRIFAARLVGCSVFDPNGDRVGKVRDVLVVYRNRAAPRVVGMIVEVPGKRRVFLSIGRITSIGAGQIITTGLINLRRFEQRGGEVRIIAELLGRKVKLRDGSGDAQIEDVAIEDTPLGEWEVTQVFLRRPKTSAVPVRQGGDTVRVLERDHRGDRPRGGPVGEPAGRQLLRPAARRPRQRAARPSWSSGCARSRTSSATSDSRMCSEELPEDDQVDILEHLDDDRAADVLDQMQPDDAADLIAQLPEARGEALLDLMEPEEAEDVRFLLSYAPDTAGGLDDHRADHRLGRRDRGRGPRRSSAATSSRPRSASRCA